MTRGNPIYGTLHIGIINPVEFSHWFPATECYSGFLQKGHPFCQGGQLSLFSNSKHTHQTQTHLSLFTCCWRGKQTPLLINQPMGKGHLCIKLLCLGFSRCREIVQLNTCSKGQWTPALNFWRANWRLFLLKDVAQLVNHLALSKSGLSHLQVGQNLFLWVFVGWTCSYHYLPAILGFSAGILTHRPIAISHV